MTEQEAKKDIIESGINLGAGDYVDVEALKVAAKALEKQIAKKPYLYQKGLLDVKMWHCPVCKKEVVSDWNRDLANGYCTKCGQKLDWE